MGRLRWKSRPLLLFEPDEADASEKPEGWKRLLRELEAGEDAVRERDMVVIRLLGNSGYLDGDQLPIGTVASLREQLQVGCSVYEAVLIGKDGGVKLRRRNGAALEEIFRRIDAMPMRRSEMEQRRS